MACYLNTTVHKTDDYVCNNVLHGLYYGSHKLPTRITDVAKQHRKRGVFPSADGWKKPEPEVYSGMKQILDDAQKDTNVVVSREYYAAYLSYHRGLAGEFLWDSCSAWSPRRQATESPPTQLNSTSAPTPSPSIVLSRLEGSQSCLRAGAMF